MSNFKDMPLDTTLQRGDVVTITGPGEHDVTVREVMGVHEHNGPFVSDMASTTIRFAHLISGLTRALTRIQRPVPALPTVEGDYILALTNGFRSVVSLLDGVWLNGLSELENFPWLTARVSEGATLSRVIPADESKRRKVDVEAAVEAFQCSSEETYEKDFEAVLERVLAGEFDL